MKTDWNDILQLLLNATGETLYMVLLAGLFTLLIGLPLGVLLFVSRRDGLLPLPRLNRALGGVINLGRSLPFVVMLIALIPLTRLIVGTTLGSTAAVVPITIGAFPFFARIVETALDEVDKGRIEAIVAMGGDVRHVILGTAARSPAGVGGRGDLDRGDADRLFIHGRGDRRWRAGGPGDSLWLPALQ